MRGDVARISPEAPVPIVEVNDSDKKLGLSANVAANVKSLGGIPMLFSLVGDDDDDDAGDGMDDDLEALLADL